MRKSKRFERIASLDRPPGPWERAWLSLCQRCVLGRIGLALLAAVTMSVVIRGWEPPFPYSIGHTPSRSIVVAVPFKQFDLAATEAARQRARRQARYVYVKDDAPLKQLRAQLRNTIVELTSAPSLDRVDPKTWAAFQLPPAKNPVEADAKPPEEQFNEFRAVFTPQENLDRFERELAEVFAPLEQRGLLEKPNPEGNQDEILVHPLDKAEPMEVRKVSDVLLGDGTALRDSLRARLESPVAADRLFAWLKPQLALIHTLTLDDERTKQSTEDAVAAVGDVFMNYSEGQVLAKANQPLEIEQVSLLKLEYAAAMAERPTGRSLSRGIAATTMIFVAFLLCGIHMRCRQRGPLDNLTQLVILLLLSIVTVALARWASGHVWRGELMPVLLFGMMMAIVHKQELALMLSCTLALIVALAVGRGLSEWILLSGTTAAAVLSLGSIRTRSKLIYVGFFAGVVAFLLGIITGMIDGQPLNSQLLRGAGISTLLVLAAGFLTTGLLPFIEKAFGVLTDLSLLELGDVAHPLLQELVRRAPSTYNHSITVGSIAEAAAESIHARGLLVRVGAYFHDIGKMLKPDYFIENQGRDDVNRHETLVPAMSTLVIIAHIKDGSDLARQHRLPQPIVDLIAQHHGTTLVEFFFGRATERQLADPNGAEVDESTFRYPGPKPQTKEAAVLMLADAVESASRTLVEPTPARIESLIDNIAESRLQDGQFDESGLTLRELRTIEKSMAMSLTSIYHGRVKYHEQRTA